MVDVLIFAGQSNCSGYSPMIVLHDEAIASPYVPAYARTALNEWTGAPPASIDTGYEYRYPKASTHPCLYVENTRGDMTGVFDAWGAFDKQTPTYPSGTLGVVGSYGPEVSFLARYRARYPSVQLTCVKQSLGGTGLRSDWLPYTVALGTARAGSANTITLASSDFANSTAYLGLSLKIISGTGAGQIRTISAYNATSKVATLSANWDIVPDATSTYGIERLQLLLLRTMLAQAAARLDASHGTGNWRWAAMVWMQGETGAHSATTAASDAQYLSDARAFFAFVRSITRAAMPIVIGRIGNNWGWETTPNSYLTAAGYPYAAIDASGTNDGRVPTTTTNRTNFLAGAVARRATQVTLGSDPNCTWYSNDDLPIRPPFWAAHTALWGATNTDLFGYHFAGPGNLTAGERAEAALAALVNTPVTPPPTVVAGKLRLTTPYGRLNLRKGF